MAQAEVQGKQQHNCNPKRLQNQLIGCIQHSIDCIMLTLGIMDGSGKSAERPVLSEEHIEQNVQSIRTLLERLLAQGGQQGAGQGGQQDMSKPLLLNNLDWFGAMPLLTFLRQVSTRLAWSASYCLLHPHLIIYYTSSINPSTILHHPFSIIDHPLCLLHHALLTTHCPPFIINM